MTDALPLRLGGPIESPGQGVLAEKYGELGRAAHERNASPLRTDVLGDREPLAQHLPYAVSQPEGDGRRPQIRQVDGNTGAIPPPAVKRQRLLEQMPRLFLFSLLAVKKHTKRMEGARKLSLVSNPSRKDKRIVEMCSRDGPVPLGEDHEA